VAPIVEPLVGRRKLDPTILPFAQRAPVNLEESTLKNVALFQVPPTFHELPEVFTELTMSETTLLLAATLLVNVGPLSLKTKPVPKLLKAVFPVNVIAPGWLLYTNPPAALRKAIEFLTT